MANCESTGERYMVGVDPTYGPDCTVVLTVDDYGYVEVVSITLTRSPIRLTIMR